MKKAVLKSLGLSAVLLVAAAVIPTGSAWAKSGVSMGKGIKCKFIPTTQADGSVVHVQVCRKFGV